MCPKRTRPRLSAWWVTACAFGISLLGTADAWARAGGGGGFSGGGGGGFSGGGGGGFSSGGSYGGGGGGDVDPTMAIFMLGLYATIWLISAYNKSKQKPQSQAGPRPKISRDDHRKNVFRLKRTDPDFDFRRFAGRVEHAFRGIQAAWCKQDLKPIRGYVSDSILERFTLQIGEQIREGYRDHMPEIDVHRDRMSLASVKVTEHFETVDICISCTAIDFRVSLETGKPVDGRSGPQTFVEYWSFLRRRGVTSQPGVAGMIEGNCPNCGSLLQLNQVGECGSCEAVVRGGEHDWVLAEITQSAAWRPHSPSQQVPSIDQFRATRDPGFTMQHAEDRGSVIFWRKAMAERNGSIDPLRKMATDQLCDHIQKKLSQSGDSGREFWHDCSVGSVDCLGIISENDFDYLLVSIHSSGNRHRVFPDGRLKDLNDWSRLRTLFVLKRQSGVTSNIERTISSAHCPSCGAPESDVASHTCSFCNEVVNDGRHDWVLHESGSADSEQAARWKKRLEAQDQANPAPTSSHPVPSPSDVIAWAIRMMSADTTVTDDEKAALVQLGKKENVPENQIQAMLSQAASGQLDAPGPPDNATARRWMTLIADIALSDGLVDSRERDVLKQLGNHLEFVDYDITLLLTKRKALQQRSA